MYETEVMRRTPPAAARQHHQTVAHSCRCVQSWPGDAENIGMRNPERLPGRPECVSDLYSAAVESLCKRHTATMASIRASRGNFAGKRDAFSNACSLPASRHSVFENQFSHGLLGSVDGIRGQLQEFVDPKTIEAKKWRMTKFYQNISKEPTRLELVKLRSHSDS